MPPEEPKRASPEALLALAKREGRGRLKIFLGAAPGVGKTYAMLAAARLEKASGREVVAGLVETHGRRETEAMLDGFEVTQRAPIVYRNRVFQEFDIDAALARHPDLLLVDEYAHTNVPGSRHPKRWHDVDELLKAGINVWTTLNIQHLESLNDVIQRITHVRVRETVPDNVLEEAYEIILVDLPPDELLRRLAEGKIYVQDTAARAVESFFKLQNLTALRELALRRAAESIDADLIERMQAQAIEGPWAAGERILACVGPEASATIIVRTARRLAGLMGAPWIVVTAERPAQTLSNEQRRWVDEAMKLAEELGGETKVLVGGDLAGELLRFARFENVTQIVIGRSQGSRWAALFRRSLPYELVRRAEDIAVHIVTTDRKRRRWRPLRGLWRWPMDLLPFVWSTMAVAVAALIGEPLGRVAPPYNMSMVFLMAVLFSAVSYGALPAIYTSTVSFLAYNFFYTEPFYTFAVRNWYDVLTLAMFLIVAITTSTFAGRVRDQATTAAQRVKATRRLYEFARKLSSQATLDAVAEVAVTEICVNLKRPALVLLENKGELELRASWPPEDQIDTASMSAAHWTFTHDEPAGGGTKTMPMAAWFFLPLRTPRDRVGVLGVAYNEDLPSLEPEARAMLDTLAEQTAAAFERAALSRDIVEAQAQAETERVRNTLLASISHDFRTPLASILGSVTGVLDCGDMLDEQARTELLQQVKSETETLDEMVRNLLAITRIDAGGLELLWDWVDLREVAERVVSAARRRGATQHLVIALPNDLPLARVDPVLVEQALGNVVANAITHTPHDARVVIDAALSPKIVSLRVTDDGFGIAPDVLSHVFEKFFRVRRSTTRSGGREGAGLGLAIAKGVMEAHGGSISAESPVANGQGTRIILNFARSENETLDFSENEAKVKKEADK
jgi:two-component system, OmpR family, sensor histidine kinase KdpD